MFFDVPSKREKNLNTAIIIRKQKLDTTFLLHPKQKKNKYMILCFEKKNVTIYLYRFAALQCENSFSNLWSMRDELQWWRKISPYKLIRKQFHPDNSKYSDILSLWRMKYAKKVWMSCLITVTATRQSNFG